MSNTPNVSTSYMYKEVKSKISIPMYFYRIIVPQLGSYYDNYPVDFDNKIVVCCPLHDEDTPSCRYYEETNSFYCFGCGRGGDVIQLHRYFAEKLNGTLPTRDESVAFIYNYFIKGNESETFVDLASQHLPKEKLNTDKDIVKLNFYRFNLEKSISFDRTLKDDVKKQLWEALDMVDLLLSKDMVKTSEAEAYLKKTVSELITIDATKKTHKQITIK